MRKQTQHIITAFLKREPARGSNTRTDGDRLFLHGNMIAWFDERNRVKVQTCGYETRTTLDRLNAIVEMMHGQRHHFRIQAGQLKEGGGNWDGSILDLGTYRDKS